MKLLNLFLAVVAATETTVASVETTAAATVVETTAAVVAETTAAEVAESTDADVAETTAADVVDPDASCDEAKSALEAAANETEKIALKTECDTACADVEGATCGSEKEETKKETKEETESGFLVNGVSFVLFAILAVFKY